MSFNLLDHLLISQLSAFLFIFCRMGAALMMMPAFGDSYVSPRTRLIFALGISVMLTPLLASKMPPMPGSTLQLGLLLVCEVLVGGFIGMIARTIVSVLHVAGTMIAYQSSLAVSAVFDPVTGTQTATISNFLTITAVTAMLAMNLHHYMLASLVESYQVFIPGDYPMAEDMFKQQLELVTECFTLGIMLAAPHIVFSFVFYLMGGLMARLMPNFQIFYVMMPPQIIIAFILLLAIVTMMMQVFLGYAEDKLLFFAGEI